MRSILIWGVQNTFLFMAAWAQLFWIAQRKSKMYVFFVRNLKFKAFFRLFPLWKGTYTMILHARYGYMEMLLQRFIYWKQLNQRAWVQLEFTVYTFAKSLRNFTIHLGRYKHERPSQPAHWDELASLVEQWSSSTPLLHNGDVYSWKDIQEFKKTLKKEDASVMVARGALANPCLFSEKEVCFQDVMQRLVQLVKFIHSQIISQN